MTATETSFAIGRRDGRSNATVLIDLVKGSAPGTVFGYDTISEALQAECDTEYSRAMVQSIVNASNPRLLREQSRCLVNVRGSGYRVAHANDHRGVALTKKNRAEAQMVRGLQVLQHVRTEEMDPQSRQSHEGMLMVVGAMYQQQRAMDRRLRAVEEAIGIVQTTE